MDPVRHGSTIDRFSLSAGMRLHCRAVLLDPRTRVELLRPLGRSSIAWATGELVDLWVVRLPDGRTATVDPSMLSMSPMIEILNMLHYAWRMWQPKVLKDDTTRAEIGFRVPVCDFASMQPKPTCVPYGPDYQKTEPYFDETDGDPPHQEDPADVLFGPAEDADPGSPEPVTE